MASPPKFEDEHKLLRENRASAGGTEWPAVPAIGDGDRNPPGVGREGGAGGDNGMVPSMQHPLFGAGGERVAPAGARYDEPYGDMSEFPGQGSGSSGPGVRRAPGHPGFPGAGGPQLPGLFGSGSEAPEFPGAPGSRTGAPQLPGFPGSGSGGARFPDFPGPSSGGPRFPPF